MEIEYPQSSLRDSVEYREYAPFLFTIEYVERHNNLQVLWHLMDIWGLGWQLEMEVEVIVKFCIELWRFFPSYNFAAAWACLIRRCDKMTGQTSIY